MRAVRRMLLITREVSDELLLNFLKGGMSRYSNKPFDFGVAPDSDPDPEMF